MYVNKTHCLCGDNLLCGKVSIRVSCGLWDHRGANKNGDGYKVVLSFKMETGFE